MIFCRLYSCNEHLNKEKKNDEQHKQYAKISTNSSIVTHSELTEDKKKIIRKFKKIIYIKRKKVTNKSKTK